MITSKSPLEKKNITREGGKTEGKGRARSVRLGAVTPLKRLKLEVPFLGTVTPGELEGGERGGPSTIPSEYFHRGSKHVTSKDSQPNGVKPRPQGGVTYGGECGIFLGPLQNVCRTGVKSPNIWERCFRSRRGEYVRRYQIWDRIPVPQYICSRYLAGACNVHRVPRYAPETISRCSTARKATQTQSTCLALCNSLIMVLYLHTLSVQPCTPESKRFLEGFTTTPSRSTTRIRLPPSRISSFMHRHQVDGTCTGNRHLLAAPSDNST